MSRLSLANPQRVVPPAGPDGTRGASVFVLDEVERAAGDPGPQVCRARGGEHAGYYQCGHLCESCPHRVGESCVATDCNKGNKGRSSERFLGDGVSRAESRGGPWFVWEG